MQWHWGSKRQCLPKQGQDQQFMSKNPICMQFKWQPNGAVKQLSSPAGFVWNKHICATARKVVPCHMCWPGTAAFVSSPSTHNGRPCDYIINTHQNLVTTADWQECLSLAFNRCYWPWLMGNLPSPGVHLYQMYVPWMSGRCFLKVYTPVWNETMGFKDRGTLSKVDVLKLEDFALILNHNAGIAWEREQPGTCPSYSRVVGGGGSSSRDSQLSLAKQWADTESQRAADAGRQWGSGEWRDRNVIHLSLCRHLELLWMPWASKESLMTGP